MGERLTHSDDNLVYACPHCKLAGNLYIRSGNGNAYKDDPDAPYYCEECQQAVYEPKLREPLEAYDRGRDPKYSELELEDVGLA